MSTNKYLFQAMDAYPYELEKSIEALEYALSYNPEDIVALCMMGCIYAEKLQDYEKAKVYFTDALAENIHAIIVYPHYINTLLWNEDFEEAKSFIAFALQVKGSDKGGLYFQQAILYEKNKEYKAALQALKDAREHTYNNQLMDYIAENEKRIAGKTKKKKRANAKNDEDNSKM